MLLLDPSWAAYAGEAGEDLEVAGTPQDLAYVIFTSGSTGRPKGAMNKHRGICNRLLWMQEEYGLSGEDRVLQKTPFSFDVSVWEFFWPLLTGARLVIARPEGHRDSTYLVKLIRESRITTLHFVPSMLRVFLEEEGLEACALAEARDLQWRGVAPRAAGVLLCAAARSGTAQSLWADRSGGGRHLLGVPAGRRASNGADWTTGR